MASTLIPQPTTEKPKRRGRPKKDPIGAETPTPKTNVLTPPIENPITETEKEIFRELVRTGNRFYLERRQAKREEWQAYQIQKLGHAPKRRPETVQAEINKYVDDIDFERFAPFVRYAVLVAQGLPRHIARQQANFSYAFYAYCRSVQGEERYILRATEVVDRIESARLCDKSLDATEAVLSGEETGRDAARMASWVLERLQRETFAPPDTRAKNPNATDAIPTNGGLVINLISAATPAQPAILNAAHGTVIDMEVPTKPKILLQGV